VLYPSAVDLGDGKMAFVITEPCVGVKDASCTEVCPVDCIHTTEEDNMFYINPDDCIDCAYCESVCPVNAIFDEFTVPSNWRGYVQKNREFFKKK
jgi:NAD-dependent dihydropyrimidine dehydrogenase PreA subunit